MNKRMRLEYQADCIEATLSSHKVRTRVTGGVMTPRFVRFELFPEPGTRIQRISKLSEELALSLNAPACRVFRRGGRIQVEVPREDPSPVKFSELCSQLDQPPDCSALLGLDEEAVPVLLCLPSADVAHVLISGNTGSGKTVLARTMAVSLALFNAPRVLQLVLIDPKRRGLSMLASLPHLLTPLIHRADEATDILYRLAQEMERRDLTGRSSPRVVVFIDELADLMIAGGKSIEQPLTRLAQRGRESGIHLVACTQRPAASVIGGLIKSNFPVRIVGSVASAEDAKVAAGLPQTGAERLLGRGDFMVIARGERIRVQGAYATSAELRRVVGQIQARQGRRSDSIGVGQRVMNATSRLIHSLPSLTETGR